MRRGFAAAVLALVLFAAASAQAQGLKKIAENVYAYEGAKNATPQNSYAANVGVVVTKEGVIVIDALISAKEGKRLLRDIRTITDKPVRYVVLTHAHLDHALGACVLTDAGALLVSHELERAYLERKGQGMLDKAAEFGLSKEDMAGTRIALPSITFTERLTLRLGGETVELIHQLPSHSTGSTLVLLPRQKVLFTGDVLFTDFHPFLGEGDIPAWAKTLDAIQAMDLNVIVPGHGPLSTQKDVAAMKDYILLFDAKARELAAQGLAPKDMAAQLKALLPSRALAENMILYSLVIKYLPAAK
jgi:glyoxylase-like metal-dependent hydrolase (beta-lactamase superfamily II)